MKLFTAGPTAVPDRIARAMAHDLIYHRSLDFCALQRHVADELKWLAGAPNSQVCFHSASGTGVMEACIVNLFEEGEQVIVVNGGKFGARFAAMARMYRLDVIELKIPWGEAATAEQLAALLAQHPQVRGVLMQSVESSTGVSHPLQAIAAMMRPDIIWVVDAICSLGAAAIEGDAIDALMASSNKALMVPPGLSFALLSEKAVARSQKNPRPRYYFDWRIELAKAHQGLSAFTPAISLMMGLGEALAMLREEGLAAVYARHAAMANMCAARLSALGFECYSNNSAVTVAAPPSYVSSDVLIQALAQQHGMRISGGQDAWQGRVIRIGHMGAHGPQDLAELLDAIEEVIQKLPRP